MKKSIFIFMLMAFAVGFTACSSDDGVNEPIENVEEMDSSQGTRAAITPATDLDESIVEFFNDVSLQENGTRHFMQPYEDKNTCLLFNSEEELAASYTGSRTLPKIDFSKYTVIVGQRVGSKMFCEITSHMIHEEEDGLVLDLFITDYSDIYNTTTEPLIHGFWGVYPKLDAKTVSVREVYTKYSK